MDYERGAEAFEPEQEKRDVEYNQICAHCKGSDFAEQHGSSGKSAVVESCGREQQRDADGIDDARHGEQDEIGQA